MVLHKLCFTKRMLTMNKMDRRDWAVHQSVQITGVRQVLRVVLNNPCTFKVTLNQPSTSIASSCIFSDFFLFFFFVFLGFAEEAKSCFNSGSVTPFSEE